MSRIVASVLFLASVTLVAADSKEPNPEPKTKTPPKADIRGKVTSCVTFRVVDGGQVATLHVVGKKEKDTKYAKGSLTIMTTTKIYTWKSGKKVAAKFIDIEEGGTVQCVIAGAVTGSNPVRGRLKEVLILAPAKAKK